MRGTNSWRFRRCSFCGRRPTDRRDILTGSATHICVSCMVDAIHALLAPRYVLDALAEGAGSARCGFCNRATLSSGLRLRRGDGVICAPCIAVAARQLIEIDEADAPGFPPAVGAELRRGAAQLAHEHPDLAIALAGELLRG